ncbi:hypothetical protein BD289DRAFT_280384 [Coniella lustricola]|uniref:Secreted protein n=1 Tax=Coniella lustricola TaxID=2025994 RepID=A0A2T3A623_9PEZI|nr:hypothetical protein BD289DRAFT_280384 [Coniella lustricola]
MPEEHFVKMASGLFANPMVLLCLAPLISSTCTLCLAREQCVIYNTFVHPDLQPSSTPSSRCGGNRFSRPTTLNVFCSHSP